MSSGRFTAYHIYQHLSFPEAQKAGTWPYKLPEYQCQHSQRGYLFQFENMVERTHFDAANTSCCNEPVLNFSNKPQYTDASRPMKPEDCGTKVESTGCTILEVYVESAQAVCADADAKIRRIKIQCPSRCPDLVAIQGGGTLAGTYGNFRCLGMEAGDVMIMDYVPDSQLVSGWYDSCSGVGTLTEEFCGGHTLSYTLRAGLNYPYGCDCDCCGENGSYSPPLMIIYSPTSINADWYNTVAVPGKISGDESCSGGNITGTFSGLQSEPVEWDGATQYSSDGYSRFVTRNPGSVGSSGNPACCGGAIYWSGTDGCGAGNMGMTTVNAKIGASTILPPSGTTLWEYQYGIFSGSGACSYSSGADLVITTSCLSNSVSALYRYYGYVNRRLVGQLRFQGTHACSGCCGSGSASVSFSNGCTGNYSADYPVRRQYSDSNQIGYAYRCKDYYLSGIYKRYKVARANLYCNGSTGGFTTSGVVYYLTLQDCINSGISGTGAEWISGAGGCSGSLYGSTDCCWYSDNGLTGYDFESRVHVVSGSRCCNVETENGAWVFSGSGNACCPAL